MATEEKLQLDRINNNVQATLRTIADTGVSVAANANSDALPAAAAALANEKQDKLTGTAGQVVGFDANGNAVAQEAPSGGGGATWAGLPDKPVVMAGGDTLTWDGNVEGKLEVLAFGEMPMVKISDVVFTSGDCPNGLAVVYEEAGVPAQEVARYEILVESEAATGCLFLEIIAIVPADGFDLDGTVFPEKGIYAAHIPGEMEVKSLTIPGYTGFGQEKIAPSHLYQPDWNQNDASAPDFFKNKPFGISKTSLLEGEFVLTTGENFGMPEFATVLAGDPFAGYSEEELAAGKAILTVVRNGVEYVCPSRQMDHLIIFGNFDLLIGEGDSGDPFVIMYVQGFTAYGDFAAQDGETVTLNFLTETIAKVPDKYLPKTLQMIGGDGYLYASAIKAMEGASGRMTCSEFETAINSGVPIYINNSAVAEWSTVENPENGITYARARILDFNYSGVSGVSTFYTAEYVPT